MLIHTSHLWIKTRILNDDYCTLAHGPSCPGPQQPLPFLTNWRLPVETELWRGKALCLEAGSGAERPTSSIKYTPGRLPSPRFPEGKQGQAYLLKGGFPFTFWSLYVHIWAIFSNWNHSCWPPAHPRPLWPPRGRW